VLLAGKAHQPAAEQRPASEIERPPGLRRGEPGELRRLPSAFLARQSAEIDQRQGEAPRTSCRGSPFTSTKRVRSASCLSTKAVRPVASAAGASGPRSS
jgi:hypothetical protein